VIRLLIADDHPIVREGLKRIIAECPDMKLVGEATDGGEAVAKCDSVKVDVILLDVSMPGPGFLETMRRLRKEHPGVKVLVLSVHPEDQYAVRALRLGASGYLTKDHSPTELAGAIRRAFKGGKYVTESLAERLAFELEADRELLPHSVLSEREYQVLCNLGAGTSVKETAAELGLSPKTVSTYRTRVLAKMKLNTNAELIRYVIKHGLVD
jgi:two-component system, NarL family, invasion response regulator UvrY